MSKPIIEVHNLGKRYRIGGHRERYLSLRDEIAKKLSRAARRAEAEKSEFWALKDVSFTVQEGEAVGIIGRNGAGKSTLLKVLSQITPPTEGHVIMRGRVASLLEVGTGFHPELTGRENIYLNGAILGMSRREIARKFDEIVAFAEVEKFLDTPVKRYSSGMYVRLAFAVAAHLEPEILVVDEVLAVGDIAFQAKCLGKMRDVALGGRTVLFVSHNLGTIKELCTQAAVLDRGQLGFWGSSVASVHHYTSSLLPTDGVSDDSPIRSVWSTVSINGAIDTLRLPVDSGEPFQCQATLHVEEKLERARLYCIIDDSQGSCIAHHFVDCADVTGNGHGSGRYVVGVSFPPLWLVPDIYTIHFKLIGRAQSGLDVRYLSERTPLNIVDSSGQMDGKVRAKLIPRLDWSLVADGVSPPARSGECVVKRAAVR